MAIKGLEQAVENLSRISKTAVPGAAAMAINRVASSAISQSASQVARETKVRRKLVKERARLKRATVKNPQARIRVNRGDLPVIRLGNARVVLSRRRRRKKGQRSSLKGGGSVLVVGNRRIPGAFIQQLKNGRWHVMQRVAGKNRYPIDVVKIPMAVPLTTAFKQNIERIRRERLPKELGYALQHQLRMVSEINRVSVVAPGRIIRCCISHPVARSKSRPGRSLLIQLRVYKRRVRRNVQGQANSRY